MKRLKSVVLRVPFLLLAGERMPRLLDSKAVLVFKCCRAKGQTLCNCRMSSRSAESSTKAENCKDCIRI